MMHLPDINVWLALSFEVHAQHQSAKLWFEKIQTESSAFCRLTQQGYLRLATNPAVFGDEAVNLTVAWSCYDQLLEDERVYFRHEPGDLEPLWRELTQGKSYSPKVWNDAYLAAFASRSGMQVVTFDHGFKDYGQSVAQIIA